MILDIFTKLVLGKPNKLLISFMLQSVVRKYLVIAESLYSCIHSFAVFPEFFLLIIVRYFVEIHSLEA